MATRTAEEIDLLLDRRQMRRRLTFWRIGALVLLGVTLLAVLSSAGVFKGFASVEDQIARVEIAGTITTDRNLIALLDRLGEEDNVKGVMLAINSPGGTAVGGEAIFEAVRRVAEKKPVVASVDALAASAGYMIATAADHIVARRASVVGSIGVILQYPNFETLLDKIGVEVNEVKSSPLKAEPSPFGTPPPEAEAMLRRFIDDAYVWFVDLVAERRPFDRATALRLADGSVYSGGQGVENKLVDALGGEREAKAWVVARASLDDDIEVKTRKPASDDDGLFGVGSRLGTLAQVLGLEPAFERVFGRREDLRLEDMSPLIPRRLFLDGVLAIWHG